MTAVPALLLAVAAGLPWKPVSTETVERLAPPPGFQREDAADGSYAAWLRRLPLKPGRPRVRLFDGREKPNQEAHEAVLDLDVGAADLQQCADAAIRLRAEYLLASGSDDLCFRFTSGDVASWKRWREGLRPRLAGRKVQWEKTAAPSSDYRTFRGFLDKVFLYAGSASLQRDLRRVKLSELAAGDLFLQGGYPGHAVVVLDVARNARGERAFLLAQSYMPAQELHVLRNPATPDSPWYLLASLEPSGGEPAALITPEWTFRPPVLRRFEGDGCGRSAK